MFDISSTEWTAILLSLRVAVVATLVATPIGIGVALLLARGKFWGKPLVDALIYLPLVLPPVVTGYLLLLLLGRRGLVGAWLADHLGIVFAFRWTGAALACGVMSFPLLVRPIRLSIEAVDLLVRIGIAAWKVASGEVTNTVLLDAMAKTELPLLFSSGMSKLSELDAAGYGDYTTLFEK